MSKHGLIEAYLTFNGNCMEALHFYEKLFNGEITSLMRYDQMPPAEDGGMADLPDVPYDAVLHSSLKVGDITIMLSDNPYGGSTGGDNITLNWSHEDENEVKRVWQAFVDAGAEVNMELEPSFFAKQFGQLTDQFGINWQLMVWSGSDPDAL